MPYARPYDTIFAFERWSSVTSSGSTLNTLAAVAVWMSSPPVKAAIKPGSAAR